MLDPRDITALLARCGGFVVEAEDGVVGTVETPLFPSPGGAPDFLVVCVRGLVRSRKPVVSTALVEDVEEESRTVRVRGRRDQISELPEHLPLAI